MTYRYTALDGLPSAAIRDITQVADERIWALTHRGLTSFDGIRWKHLSAPETLWYHISPSLSGGAWLSGRHAGDTLTLLDSEGHVEAEVTLPTDIDPLKPLVGFSAYRTPKGREELAVAIEGHGFLRFDGSRWHRLETRFGDDRMIHAIVARPGGEIWGCTSNGIVVWSHGHGPRHLVPSQIGAPSDEVFDVAFATGKSKTPWLIGRGWLGRLSATGQLDSIVSCDFMSPPRIVEVGPADEVYLGNESVVHRMDPTNGTVDTLTVDESMVGNGANAMFRDRDLNVWIGCNRGLTRIPPRRFHLFDKRHGLLEDEVSAIAFSGDRTYFGHNSGISMSENGRFKTWELPSKALNDNCRILELEPDSEGGVYFAANCWGIGRLRADGIIERYRGANAENPVLSICRSPEGEIWVGTAYGLARLEDGALSGEIRLHGEQTFVRRVDVAPDGDLILSTMSMGLFIGRPGRWRQSKDENPANVFTTTRFEGRLLVGTLNGLFELADDTLRLPWVEDLRIDVPVYALHVAPDGILWCGTDRGVQTWDGTVLREYTARSGFAGQEVNRDALKTDPRGKTWIGTETGVAVYLGELDLPRRPPKLEIRSCTAGGRSLSQGDCFEVASTENTLHFELHAVSFVGDASILVRWRLHGHEESWHRADAAHAAEIVYSNLPPGRFRLEVEALNAREESTGIIRSPEIVVAKPIWMRSWFLASSIIALGLLGWGFADFIAVRRERTRLERLARERADAVIGLERRLHHSEKLSALGQLAGGVAHDFNNLLTAIIGSCDMIRLSGGADQRVLEDIEPIERAAESGAALVEQLLAVGRRQKLAPEPIDLNRSLTEFARLARRALGNNVTLEVQPADHPVVALVDRGQLDQIVMNLLINAGDAMPTGGLVEASSSLESLESDEVGSLTKGRYASMAIRDHGAGIPEDVIEHIFEPFFTTKEPGAGTGLGLASVYGAVRQARGDLAVETGPNGTTFRVYLPATAAILPKDRQKAATPDSQRDARVLVVDDDLRVLELTAKMLSELGFRVRAARDAKTALEVVHESGEEPFDLLLTDVVMPDSTGPELARRVRLTHPHIGICFMTGFADLRGAGKDIPGDAPLLRKPFRIDELKRAMRVMKPFEPAAGRVGRTG